MLKVQIIQSVSLLMFITGACLYYNIRRLLHRHGYPVSVFVYSGPCWGHYKDLIEKSPPSVQRKLRNRKRAMCACLILALILMFTSGFIRIN